MGDEQFGRRRTEALVQSGELLRNGIPRLKRPSALAERRAKEIRLLVEAYWERANPDICMPWTAREEKALADLVSTTRLCGLDFHKLLDHREHLARGESFASGRRNGCAAYLLTRESRQHCDRTISFGNKLEDLPADGDPAPYLAAIEGRKLVIDGLNRAIERRLSERGAE